MSETTRAKHISPVEAIHTILSIRRWAGTCVPTAQRDLSQEAFADQIGVHRTYMGGVERDERNLTLKNVEKTAEKLEVEMLES
ncbi:transcriptional regulator, PvuIIC domain protein [Actinomyces johnsonii F0510]|uniref:Transcriptional regulator, PvuIIC domain protein n=1 Tax=Actinomyces johnsonii F0510 TaxID=1227262 RepID=U1RR15_9ACTO|nr:transcriptional regulator, PvuIIC domain protein [Actinomyces johnsonii F0510]